MKAKGKDGFYFYRSFMEAARILDESGKAALIEAIIRYGLDKEEPTLQGDAEKVAWVLIRPILDKDWIKYENGCNGGAPKGNQNARKQPKTTENNLIQPNSSNPIYDENKTKNEKESITPSRRIIDDDNSKEERQGGLRVAPLEGTAQPPTMEVVAEHAASKGIDADEAQKFYTYYQACGWKTKNGDPVRDWRRLLASWMKRQQGDKPKGEGKTKKDYDPNIGVKFNETNEPKGKDDLLWWTT